jgi:DNA invertase Pin-like site-specific DNA recombinase
MIGYARVSMSDQDNRRQIDDLIRFGVDPRDIYEDKASGRDMKRPGWQAAWRDLSEGDLLIVYSIDRLGRDLIEVVRTVKELHERGCDIKVLSMDLDTRTPTGRLIFAIVAAMAQWERELIVERTRHGLAAARARGIVGGQKKQVSDKQVRAAMKKIEQAGGAGMKAQATVLGISRQALDKRIKQLREIDRGKEALKDAE